MVSLTSNDKQTTSAMAAQFSIHTFCWRCFLSYIYKFDYKYTKAYVYVGT